MNTLIDIPLSSLIPSPVNVRRTTPTQAVEELAASIAAHGLLQNLTVRLAPPEKQKKSGAVYEVIAGGRRLAALKLLAKRGDIDKAAPICCHPIRDGLAEEISLAENALQCPMHPADQFEAFAKLHTEYGMNAEDIAARFGVTATVVLQRLKLGMISPKLIKAYRKGELDLDQLTAFAVTDDHQLQERVFADLPGYRYDRHSILEALRGEAVSANDRRARFVGAEAYEAAGGHITRDLFDDKGGGFFDDAELLNRLATEKLQAEAALVTAEGWKWVEIVPRLDYSVTGELRHVYPQRKELTEAEHERLDDLEARYEEMSESDEADSETVESLEAEIAELTGEAAYRAEDMSRGGAFITLGHDGGIRIERGYIRAEDAPKAERGKAARRGDGSPAPMSDKLVGELTSHRTAGLRDCLAQHSAMALTATVHALAASVFFPFEDGLSCLDIQLRSKPLSARVPDIDETLAMKTVAARQEGWQRRMPEAAGGLWDFVTTLPLAEQVELLAHCVSLSVDAVCDRAVEPCGPADTLARSIGLDMTAYWTVTPETYLARVSKERILDAVREGVTKEAAENLAGLKKQALVTAAAERLAGTHWLPELLRLPAEPVVAEAEAERIAA